MAIIAVVGMLLFIVPIFSNMFASLGGTLPARPGRSSSSPAQ